jgi:hypothetical protein
MRSTVALRNAKLAAIAASFNSGKLRIYSGTRPTNADTALSGNTLLAELTLSSTAFPAPSAGALTANAIANDASADATGTASFVRIFQSDGVTALADLSVGVGTGELQFSTLSIVAAAIVVAPALVLTEPVGT